jgi:hypothetical protein
MLNCVLNTELGFKGVVFIKSISENGAAWKDGRE